MKGTWVSKGDVREMCLKESNQNEEKVRTTNKKG